MRFLKYRSKTNIIAQKQKQENGNFAVKLF